MISAGFAGGSVEFARVARCSMWLLCFWPIWSTVLPQTKDDWQQAESAIVRLSPGDFAGVPADVRADLEHRSCTIPQPYNAGGEKKNVISGQFSAAGQTDWAALCSHDKRSAILVFRGGHADHVDTLAEEADSKYLQVVNDDRKIGFSRSITVASTNTVRRHFPKAKLRMANHDGIENTFLGKASVVWYRSGEHWISAPGSD